MVMTLCKALKPLLDVHIKNLEYIFVYCIVWSLAGGLSEKDGTDYRKEFSTWWKAEWKTSVKFPPKGTIFDYYVETGDSVKFEEWGKKVSTLEFDTMQGHQMGNFTVPTKETVSISEFINNLILVQHGCLLIGNAGAGKT
jgi:dynein heavy chain